MPEFLNGIGPKAERDPAAAKQLKQLFATYRQVRIQMKRHTVLPGDAGVSWSDGTGQEVLWSFKTQPASGKATAVVTGEAVSLLQSNRVYYVIKTTPVLGP